MIFDILDNTKDSSESQQHHNVMKQQNEKLKNELSKLSNKGNLLRSLQEDKHKLIKQINSLNLEINVQLSADTASVAIQEWQTSKKGRTVDA